MKDNLISSQWDELFEIAIPKCLAVLFGLFTLSATGVLHFWYESYRMTNSSKINAFLIRLLQYTWCISQNAQ